MLTEEYINRLILNGISKEAVTAPSGIGSLPGQMPKFLPPKPTNAPVDYVALIPDKQGAGNNTVSEIQKRYKNLRQVAEDQADARVHAIFLSAAKMAANVYVQANRVQYGLKLQENREMAHLCKSNN